MNSVYVMWYNTSFAFKIIFNQYLIRYIVLLTTLVVHIEHALGEVCVWQ